MSAHKLADLFGRNRAVRKVAFIRQKEAGKRVAVGLSNLVVEISFPLKHFRKGGPLGDIEYDDARGCLLVIHSCHGAEALLARNIPQLQGGSGVN